MKRDFLKGLNLEDAVIDQIMAEHGKTVSAIKGDVDADKNALTAKDTEIAGLKQQLAQRDKDIESLKKSGGDLEAVKAQLDELQGKYKTDTDALTQQLADQKTAFDRQTASEKFFSGVKFSSALAKRAAMAEFDKAALELKEGEYVGAKDWLEKLKKDAPDAFHVEPEPDKPPLPRFAGGMGGQGGAGKGAATDQFNFSFTPVRKVPKE